MCSKALDEATEEQVPLNSMRTVCWSPQCEGTEFHT
jgi:hypothetical protein